jgi:ATPase subunit of ABC transporter with duplicated ATPase domains
MQLACAQLIEADILMIDDPTGHLDVKNIQWVKKLARRLPWLHHCNICQYHVLG